MNSGLQKLLSKLRKQSNESVDNTDSFDEFKKYLHVSREVERELVDLLKKLKTSEKCLVLLCGSAGDGKSHLLSYLKNREDEDSGLLDDFFIHNDATESDEPERTCIDTLREVLKAFDNNNIDNRDEENNKKIIVAINLGTLLNFISREGERFTRLKEYVIKSGILSSYNKEEQVLDEVIHHINFSDYHIFDLDEKGANTEYLEEIFGKIFDKSDSNPFSLEFEKNRKEVECLNDIVLDNYEFFRDSKSRQKNIIDKLVEVVVKDKVLLSTRDVLNFIYDMLVYPEDKNIGEGKYRIEQYAQKTTPMIIYENKGVSSLMAALYKHDNLKYRDRVTDEDTMNYFTANDVSEKYKDAIKDVIYGKNTPDNLSEWLKPDEERKNYIYLYILRLLDLRGRVNKDEHYRLYNDYLRALYYQAIGNCRINDYKRIYGWAKNAIMKWNGDFGKDRICIDGSNPKYWLIEEIKIEPVIPRKVQKEIDDSVVRKFSTDLKLTFKVNGDAEKTHVISVDYSLFKLIYVISEMGYVPNIKDRTRHREFSSFVDQISEDGLKRKCVYIVNKRQRNQRFSLSVDDAGYSFERVE